VHACKASIRSQQRRPSDGASSVHERARLTPHRPRCSTRSSAFRQIETLRLTSPAGVRAMRCLQALWPAQPSAHAARALATGDADDLYTLGHTGEIVRHAASRREHQHMPRMPSSTSRTCTCHGQCPHVAQHAPSCCTSATHIHCEMLINPACAFCAGGRCLPYTTRSSIPRSSTPPWSSWATTHRSQS
jgi:hypothetical protein